ncbi:YlcI/YnfO family protein [Pseudoxanthomonas sp.]|uniref:YlcI/YnfO family protein n=1 Tax=Pseudoxanthomonas sp. TaxID=1871049 RepID=UPI0028C5084E|nr:YlcI/YnfO family protein [Pseudoxanthomonas sp.]
MKTSTFPSLRVDPALRKAAEDVLREGESLSGFVEQSIRAQIDLRQQQEAFIARGLASRDDARRTGVYHDAVDVVAELRAALHHAKAGTKGRR